jgi:hypothetical protein
VEQAVRFTNWLERFKKLQQLWTEPLKGSGRLMTKKILAIMLLAGGAALAMHSLADEPTITQDELVLRTQELFDAIVPGNQEPFKKYFADDAMFFDEKGRSMDKAALVKDVQPMPKGYSGTI